MQHWLIKSDSDTYAWKDLVNEKKTAWTGVRNFQARNNLANMQKGDKLLFYHSGEDKAVVGEAKVVKAHYPDPTATEGNWVCVDVAPDKAFKQPVTLAAMRLEPSLKNFMLLRQGRLSVIPATEEEYYNIVRMGNAIKK